MGLPIWIYDYKAKRYVVFPFHLFESFDNGTRGFRRSTMTRERGELLNRFAHLFQVDHSYEGTNRGGIPFGGLIMWMDETRYILRERKPTKDSKTGAKWYSREDSQIKKFKRKRK